MPSPASNLKALRQRKADTEAEITRLKGEIARLTDERSALGEAAIAGKRALTDDERTKFGALGTQIKGLETQFADAEELLGATKTALALAVKANDDERHANATPDADADTADAAARDAGIQHTPGSCSPNAASARGVWGRQLPGRPEHQRYPPGRQGRSRSRPRHGGPDARRSDRAQHRCALGKAGFLVAPERATTILQRTYSIGQILARVFHMPIGPNSNGMKLPAIDETSRADNSRFGGIVSGWLGQGNTLSTGKPKFREMDLKLRKVGAFVYATDEQLADSIALEAWINRYLPLELMYRTEDAVVNGTGATMPVGVVNSGAAVNLTRQTASRVLYEDVSAMWARMWAGSRGNAVWLIDQSVEPELEKLQIAIGVAGVLAPVYRPAGAAPNAGMVGAVAPEGMSGGGPGTVGNQVYGTLYGRPVIPVEYCAALGTVGDIILVSFDEYVVIDKGDVEQAVSLHVAFLTDDLAVFRSPVPRRWAARVECPADAQKRRQHVVAPRDADVSRHESLGAFQGDSRCRVFLNPMPSSRFCRSWAKTTGRRASMPSP